MYGSALAKAIDDGHTEIVRLLLAFPRINVNAQGKEVRIASFFYLFFSLTEYLHLISSNSMASFSLST